MKTDRYSFAILILFLLVVGFKNDNEFKLCNSGKLYATNDYLYKDSYFKEYEKVNDFPKYSGGQDSIQKYFNSKVTLTGDETQIVAKYHIIFVVNCNGELGRFEIKSKKFAGFDKILSACKKMENWIPGRKDNTNIDCYVRLGFTNAAGKLKVEYREK